MCLESSQYLPRGGQDIGSVIRDCLWSIDGITELPFHDTFADGSDSGLSYGSKQLPLTEVFTAFYAGWIVQPPGVSDDHQRIVAASEVRRCVEAYSVFSDVDLHNLRVPRKRPLVEVVEDGKDSLLGKDSRHEAASFLCASAYIFRVPEKERSVLRAAGVELTVAVEPGAIETAHS